MIDRDENFSNFNSSAIGTGAGDTRSGAESLGGARLDSEQIKQKAEQLRQEAQTRVDQLRQQAQSTYDHTKEEAKRVLEEAKQRGLAEVEGRKRYVVDEVGGFASALHSTARQLHDQNQPHSAHYIEQAAGTLERLAQNLRGQDLGAMVRQVEDFARRQPALFLGGAVAAGFLLARFLKSSSTRSGDYGYPQSYDAPGYGSGRFAERRATSFAAEAQPLEQAARNPNSALNVNTSAVGIPENVP